MPQTNEQKAMIREHISKALHDLVPSYLENRQQDLEDLKSALTAKDSGVIKMISFKTLEHGEGYGFQGLVKIAEKMVLAAQERNFEELQVQIECYADYLRRLDIVFDS